MKRFISLSLLSLSLLQLCFAPPVTQQKEEDLKDSNPANSLEDYMEYHRYLKEVVDALESDPHFREKLEKANETDIRSGKIAEELEFVSHHVRNRLDEIKRVELTRLKELIEKKRRLQENGNGQDPNHGHLDHFNPHTFEIEDLKKLIAKTTEDLAEVDRKRREQFKEYEMNKEYAKRVKLNLTDEEERAKLEKEFKEREEKHKKHERLHEPGHKAQLEEVWQEQDQMQQEFDPKTFFMLHDMDSNGLWDQDEVKALFIKELEKMYAAGEPEDDMRERAEEMERMRETVFKEVDLNRDGFIDFDEFLAQTKRNDFQQDHGWQGLDERKPYTEEELAEYIRQHQAHQAQAYAQAQAYHGYPPQGQAPPGAYHQVPPGYHPPQQQFHPGQQIPPQHPQQLPGQLPDLNTNEIYQQHPNQPPQGYQQQPVPRQVPQSNIPNGGYQPPQGGYHQQQQHPPQGGYQQQQHPPQGGYQQQQRPPQGSYQQQQHPPQGHQQPPQGGYQQQQQPPQVVNQQQQQPPQVHQQPQGSNPQQGNPQNVPAQGNIPNVHNQESPQVNQV